MPLLSGTQSPFLQNVFTRPQDVRPLAIDISALTREKPPLPQIVITPSTPLTEEKPFEYPFGRLKSYPIYHEDDEDDEDNPLLREPAPIRPKWKTLIPLRALRIACIFGVILGLVAFHLILFHPGHPDGDKPSQMT
ncbi:uncharacterized protein EI90DRAFT_3116572 [Cantharellus anzutake]|uniref:uncharacterized protein n=1 Tax=Cantharellus anzutake TaxID=1750568 RepID=UPI00190305DB|nr:uncharacterized protein EI90DRAFT_3116572 [Cantharellus anzutake]KAF8341448.1 hypothetical protein EI90DRAFT_3116572 [Cantharellus anzutake]